MLLKGKGKQDLKFKYHFHLCYSEKLFLPNEQLNLINGIH